MDDEDYERLASFPWSLVTGYAIRTLHSGSMLGAMHRHVLEVPTGVQVDHINRNKLDNRRANLREATHSQNCANKGPSSRNVSGYKGLSWCKRLQRWRVDIFLGGRPTTLGYLKDPIEAARLYNGAAYDEWGDYAYLNEV